MIRKLKKYLKASYWRKYITIESVMGSVRKFYVKDAFFCCVKESLFITTCSLFGIIRVLPNSVVVEDRIWEATIVCFWKFSFLHYYPFVCFSNVAAFFIFWGILCSFWGIFCFYWHFFGVLLVLLKMLHCSDSQGNIPKIL